MPVPGVEAFHQRCSIACQQVLCKFKPPPANQCSEHDEYVGHKSSCSPCAARLAVHGDYFGPQRRLDCPERSTPFGGGVPTVTRLPHTPEEKALRGTMDPDAAKETVWALYNASEEAQRQMRAREVESTPQSVGAEIPPTLFVCLPDISGLTGNRACRCTSAVALGTAAALALVDDISWRGAELSLHRPVHLKARDCGTSSLKVGETPRPTPETKHSFQPSLSWGTGRALQGGRCRAG